MDILKELFSLKDLKYKEFHKKLIPNVDEDLIIGVRTPLVKKLTKTVIKEGKDKEFLEYVNHPLLKIVWDTGHGNLKDTPQYDALTHLGKYVYALHVQNNRGHKDDHTAPFLGTLDIDSLMKGLIEIGYNGYFTFEASNIFAPIRSKGTLNKDNPLSKAPLSLKIKMESMLYEIGKHILTSYNEFED